MPARSRRFTLPALVGVAVLAAAAVLAACGDDDDDPVVEPPTASTLPSVPKPDVLVTAIRHVADLRPPDDDKLPVVYVVAVGENGIGAGLQADVASALLDDIDVRFADERSEAVDDSEEGAPVIDGGVLMLVGDVPDQAEPVSIAVEVYYDEADRTRQVFTLETEPAGGTAPPDSSVWRVTATSLVALDAPT